MQDLVIREAVLSPGEEAPDFELRLPNGQTGKLSDLKGAPVVLAFFPDSWDPARPHQLAHLNRLLARIAPHTQIVDLAKDGGWLNVQLDGEPKGFPLIQNLADRDEVAELYGVAGKHALFVLDGQGRITWQHVGPIGSYPPIDELALALGSQPSGLSRRQFMVTAVAASLLASLAPKLTPAEAPKLAPAPSEPGYPLHLTINGIGHHLEVDPRTSLLDLLRERLALTGTKKGCDHGQCGACTVHVDGRRINACLTLALQAEGAHVTTVEGLAHGEQLHPVQAAFVKHDGYQCGYCTSGQIMSAVACIHEGHAGSDEEIKEWMSGNLCRCGAYVGICEAIKEAKTEMGGGK